MDNRDARKEYADIIDLPHHQSAARHHMSLYDRAAQFAPFAALVGYDEMIAEEGRLTDRQLELSEQEMAELNRMIALLESELNDGRRPYVALTYFVPDERKSGGRYVQHMGYLKRIDRVNRQIILYGGDEVGNKQIAPLMIAMDSMTAITVL